DANLGRVEGKAVAMLIDEVEKRTGIHWEMARETSRDQVSITLHAEKAEAKEGFAIRATENQVSVTGNDERGLMFGVGRLLRELRMSRGKISIEDGFMIATSPRYPLRGHQLGYRPKTHS